MNLRTPLGCILLSGALLVPLALAQKKGEGKKGDAPAAQKKEAQKPAEMEAWAKYAEPGKPHELFKSLVGTWAAQSKMWMDAKSPPLESRGTSENKLIMGGRFLQQDYHGQMMDKPFTGMGVTGYDNYQKKYISTWIDTMGTTIVVSEGAVDPSGKVLTTVADYDNPATGKKMKSRMVTRVEGPEKHTYEIYDTLPDGKEVKILQIVYTRK